MKVIINKVDQTEKYIWTQIIFEKQEIKEKGKRIKAYGNFEAILKANILLLGFKIQNPLMVEILNKLSREETCLNIIKAVYYKL